MSGNIVLNLSSKNGILEDEASQRVRIAIAPPIRLDNSFTWKLRLHSASLWYTAPNVSQERLQNATVQYVSDGTDPLIPAGNYSFVLSTGRYTLGDIENAINSYAFGLGHLANSLDRLISIGGNESTQQSVIEIRKEGIQIDFSGPSAGFATIFGFDPILTPATPTVTTSTVLVSQNRADVAQNILAYQIHCDLASGAYSTATSQKARQGDVLATVPLGREIPNNAISVEPFNMLEVGCGKTFIDSISMYLTDQDGLGLNLNGEEYSVTLEIIPEQ